MNQKEYESQFGVPKKKDHGEVEKVERALEHALDIRKFEIGLYWQRATYFWALIAVAFAGYFAILSADNLNNKEFLAFFVACIGSIFTWAWFLANRGSKYWQENWENHVDMLEDSVIGPLYKTVMRRPDDEEIEKYLTGQSKSTFFERYITGPKAISVSKINQLVSLFTLILWLFLVVYSVIQTCFTIFTFIVEIIFGFITATFFFLLYTKTETYVDNQSHIAKKRGGTIVGP